ncbi:MAG TPA: hypothetical protein VIS06_01150 [Mycobacteriales bacterium]
MSRERARRREARQAESRRRVAEARARTERQVVRARRRAHRRRAVRSVLPWSPGQRRNRRTRAQRGSTAVAVLAVVVLVWMSTDSWSVRIVLLLAALVVTPAVMTLVLDRSNR